MQLVPAAVWSIRPISVYYDIDHQAAVSSVDVYYLSNGVGD